MVYRNWIDLMDELIADEFMEYFLSNCLLLSAVQPSNPKEAMKWLKLSAENGYVRAQYQLALCLHQGRVVQTNLLEAVCAFF